jgi:hypothetical protein
LLFDLIAGETPRFSLPRPVPRPTSRFGHYAPQRAWLVSAVAWKDFHFLHGGRPMQLVRWIGYGAICVVVTASRFGTAALLGKAAQKVVYFMFIALCVELCLIGSRILRVELRDKTLVGLAGLPLSMQHIMMMKLDGARRALMPSFTWICTGFALMLASAIWSNFDNTRPDTGGFFGMLIALGYFGSQAWLLAHLAAHFSLKFQWGALPLSFAVVFIANLVGAMFCIGFFVMPIVALTYVTQLRASMFQRLEELAAED